jgi:hypothetical protein
MKGDCLVAQGLDMRGILRVINCEGVKPVQVAESMCSSALLKQVKPLRSLQL